VGAALLAPVADDARSRLRSMEEGCRVTRVVDGDTVDVACPGRSPERARIVGYDAPELFSPGCAAELAAAEAARSGLSALVLEPVEVAFLGRDKYDRALVDMRAGGERVAARMVADGHGRRYLGGARGGWCGWG
jgi:endonuclease YncB( thermonuclease family)